MAEILRQSCLGLKTGQNIRGSQDSILSLRAHPNAINIFLDAILNLTQQESVEVFHAITGVQAVLLKRWYVVDAGVKVMVRDWLLQLGVFGDSNRRFEGYVRNSAVCACAVLWKRGWVEMHGSSSNNNHNNNNSEYHNTTGARIIPNTAYLFTYLTSILNTPSTSNDSTASAKVYTCTFLSSLVSEMSTLAKATSSLGLSLEFHKASHSSFEGSGLESCLKLSMSSLSSVIAALNSSDFTDETIALTVATTSLTIDVLSWEFGASYSNNNSSAIVAQTLIKPPKHYAQYLIHPDFLAAIFSVYTSTRSQSKNSAGTLPHKLRQLLLMLSSVSGVIFESEHVRALYAKFMVDGVLAILLNQLTCSDTEEGRDKIAEELLDVTSIISRLTSNFKLQVLSTLESSFVGFLSQTVTLSNALYTSIAHQIEVECAGNYDEFNDTWKFEAFNSLIDALVCISEDTLITGNNCSNNNRMSPLRALITQTLKPLYPSILLSRIKMSRAEEMYNAIHQEDLDEVSEGIDIDALKEFMVCMSAIGRLNFADSLGCVVDYMNGCTLPGLQRLFEFENGHEHEHDNEGRAKTRTTRTEVTPDAAALLEEATICIMFVCNLLTDENVGEADVIPSEILASASPSSSSSCERDQDQDSAITIAPAIHGIVNSLMQLASYQASRIASTPHDPNLSPLLAESLVWFFTRFLKCYVLPDLSLYTNININSNPLLTLYNTPQSTLHFLDFTLTLTLHYNCYWPQEKALLASVKDLVLDGVCKDNRKRGLLCECKAWVKLAALFNVAGASTSNSTGAGTVPQLSPSSPNLTQSEVTCFSRLGYAERGYIVSMLTCGCAGLSDDTSLRVLEATMTSVQRSLDLLISGASANTNANTNANANGRDADLAGLVVELFGGVARAPFVGFDASTASTNSTNPSTNTKDSYTLTKFLTPNLPHLAKLMHTYGGDDFSVCFGLLRVFRDYAECYITFLNVSECFALYSASSELLGYYCAHHASSSSSSSSSSSRKVRGAVVSSEDEENVYGDVLCAIQLLNIIGTKDFIDVCGSSTSSSNTNANASEDTYKVEPADVIFHNLQLLLPIMTNGLLQYPKLCSQFFSLLGYVVENYPEKLEKAGFAFFETLARVLLWGCTHVDLAVARACFRGIEEICKKPSLHRPLRSESAAARGSCLLQAFVARIVEDVVFSAVVLDRVDVVGGALAQLIAVDVAFFVEHVSLLLSNTTNQVLLVHRERLSSMFERLVKREIIGSVNAKGLQGRQARVAFKTEFLGFVKESHGVLNVM